MYDLYLALRSPVGAPVPVFRAPVGTPMCGAGWVAPVSTLRRFSFPGVPGLRGRNTDARPRLGILKATGPVAGAADKITGRDPD